MSFSLSGPLGESLVWSAEEAALWWVDIVGSHIHRFHPASGAHADTLTNALHLHAHDAAAERLTDRRELAPSIARGLPDGSARDRAGRIYNARVVGGAAIVRIDPDKAVEFFHLPCRSPTSCAFGSADLRTLHVTSSRFGMSGAEPATSPAEGGLFALDAGAEGLPPHRFG